MDLSKTMSYTELKQLNRDLGLRTTDAADRLHAHHSSVQNLMKKLLENGHGRTVLPKGSDPLLDGAPGVLGPGEVPMPNFMIPQSRHNGGFHSFLSEELDRLLPRTDAGDPLDFEEVCSANPGRAKDVLREALREAYGRMQTSFPDDGVSYEAMGKITDAWIDQVLP